MKVVVLYHPESEHARSVLTFQRDFEKLTTKQIELLSLETVEGAELAKLYAISQYPAVVVTADGGELLRLWEGETLPLINEVASYLL